MGQVLTLLRNRIRWLAVLLAGLACTTAPAAWSAPNQLDQVKQTQQLKVCIWPEYYGVTYRDRHTNRLVGMDVDVAGLLASDLGVALRFIDSDFQRFFDDVEQRRCDIAMFAIAVTPERQARLAFSQAYMRSDLYFITTRSNRLIRRWEDLDQQGVIIGVVTGSVMESTLHQRFHHATLHSMPMFNKHDLEAGRIDAFATNLPYARRLVEHAQWARVLSPAQPFALADYAYAVAPGEEAWLQRINQFIQSIQSDGRLHQIARRYQLESIVVAP